MSLKVYYQLWKMRRHLSASSSFKRTLRGTLDAKWKERCTTAAPSYGNRFFKWSFAMVAVVVFLASLSTGAYAYTSQEVTEGHLLYPLKRNLEAVEGKLYHTPERKARFEKRQAERRKAEQATIERREFRAKETEKQMQEVRTRRLEIEKRLEAKEEKHLSEDAKRQLEKNKERLQKQEKALEKKRNNLLRKQPRSAP